MLELRESKLPDNPPHWGTGVSRKGGGVILLLVRKKIKHIRTH